MLTRIKISRKVPRNNGRGNRLYSIWLCHCGKQFEAENTNISVGNTKSCGCLNHLPVHKTTHNMSRTPTYKSWTGLRERCDKKTHRAFKNYGGRGITYEDKWKTFEGFYEDMGIAPKGKSLDRIDVNGDYRKSNCRWATPKEQANNTRKNRLICYNGETLNTSQWASRFGISSSTIFNRIKFGWELSKVFSKKNYTLKTNQ